MKTMFPDTVVIGVDFDGTITTSPDISTKPMELQQGCYNTLYQLYNKGLGNYRVRLVLWTARTGQAYKEALEFLVENHLYHMFDAFNDQLPCTIVKYGESGRKLGADVYIDDRNVGAIVNWAYILNQLQQQYEGGK